MSGEDGVDTRNPQSDERIVLTMGKRNAIPVPSLPVHTSCEERLAPMLARIRLQGRIHALP